MLDLLREVPGRLYVLATLLPLLAAVVLMVAGTFRRLRTPISISLSPIAGYFAVAVMAVSAACSIVGLCWYVQDVETYRDMPATLESRWAERTDWVRIGGLQNDPHRGLALELGYRIDQLTAAMFSMVTVIGTLIFTFSLGYMREERSPDVHDSVLHIHRPGRFGRFYIYMSLFAFSMLNLLIADNLLQVFISWELVGVSSFYLIGFYTERPTAGNAANKAFIMNRIGDAGFLIGLAVVWTHAGTFNFLDLFAKMMIQSDLSAPWLTWMGLGIFAGCVGKSAQVPLHTWLPDAMEGPTPVSALIHAATMVAAGVYLVGRAFPLFNADVLQVIAYTGAITLFLSALIATVQTDIKRVLAFSTGSQLGYMMLALGLGGWTAGLFHLLTHAFFKALLFLCAGSVIHALHHEQSLLKMGGLRRKLPITAYTMLIGVMAIIGVPLFSGWYSKDMILTHALASDSLTLSMLPFITVVLTGYYMTRLWLLAFAGTPRDVHVHSHAHESPAVMTLPLIVLAVFSIGIAWGWPVWNAHASVLRHFLEPTAWYLTAPKNVYIVPDPESAERVGLLCAAGGVAAAVTIHRRDLLSKLTSRAVLNRFYFDALYDALVTRPTLAVAALCGRFDKRTDSRPFDAGTLDGSLAAVGEGVAAAGRRLAPVQSGRLQGYVLVLGLTVVAGLGILAYRLR